MAPKCCPGAYRHPASVALASIRQPGNGSHHLRVVPSVRAWHWNEQELANPVTSGTYSGKCVLTLPVFEPTERSFETQSVVSRVEKTVGEGVLTLPVFEPTERSL